MDEKDRSLLRELQKGIPLTTRPFLVLGERVAIDEKEVITRLNRLRDETIIRKFRARINQRKAGIMANALVAWDVDLHLASGIAETMAKFPGVTHCYLRATVPGRWEYCLYTVHHAPGREDIAREVEGIAAATGAGKYLILYSGEEYKHTPAGRILDKEEQG